MDNNQFILGCGALIVNNKEEVLLQKRKNTTTFNNLWSRPGGTVEWGEELTKALKREVLEELGVEIEVLDFLDLYEDIRSNRHGVYFGFLAKITKGEPKNLEPDKCEDLKWFSIKKIPKNTTEYTINSIKAYLNKKDK